MKKTILTILVTFIITMILVTIGVGLYGYYGVQKNQPNYTKILTEQEIDNLIDDTVFELGGKLAKKDHTDNGEFNMYSASFSAEGLGIELNFDDMTKWSKETMKNFTNDPDVKWDKFILKSYYKMVKMFAESVHFNFVYYEDNSHLSEIMGYDVEVNEYDPYEDNTNYVEVARTVIGNYKLRVMVRHEDESAVLNMSEPRLKIFMENYLDILKN